MVRLALPSGTALVSRTYGAPAGPTSQQLGKDAARIGVPATGWGAHLTRFGG
jgi:hypothetical protein